MHLLFLWLRSAELATHRVAERVQAGGHDVPPSTVIRRYSAGLRNLFQLYLPLADEWQFYDNSESTGPRRVAASERANTRIIADTELWRDLREKYFGR
jgi:predicted ABC-type ATPase